MKSICVDLSKPAWYIGFPFPLAKKREIKPCEPYKQMKGLPDARHNVYSPQLCNFRS